MTQSQHRVVLAVAPARHRSEMLRMLGRMPTLGILYLAAVLEEAGHTATTLDRQYEQISPMAMASEILALKPALVGFTLYDTNMEFTRAVIQILRLAYGGPIVAGGYAATFHAHDLLNRWPELNYVVLREGEKPLLQLIEHLDGKRSIDQVPNLAYRDGETIAFGPEAPLADVARLPHPRREWPEPGDATPIMSRRGCTSRCTFCSSVQFYAARSGPVVRRRRAEDVVDEIAHCVDNGSRLFIFYDENFGLQPGAEQAWVSRFVQEIARRDLSISFLIEMRIIDVIRGTSLLPDLCEVGMAHIALGMESLLPRQLKLFGKGHNIAAILQAVDILDQLQVDYQTNLIFWDPYSTLDEALEHTSALGQIRFYDQLASANYPFYGNILTARRGTSLYDSLAGAGILRNHPDAWYLTEYDFVDPAVRQFHQGVYPQFLRRISVPRLPALWLNIPKLELQGQRQTAAALRAYARDLARAEFDYFQAVLQMARETADPAERKEQLDTLDEDLGDLFRMRASPPPGIAI